MVPYSVLASIGKLIMTAICLLICITSRGVESELPVYQLIFSIFRFGKLLSPVLSSWILLSSPKKKVMYNKGY
uniref:Uncharacterized protein n=1 Tax=Arundo donax TaxID=35708 RepID=A0A0A9ELY3_ARUDO